ncbi:MAG: hypothetical protein Q8O59_01965 [bacterium]|nr:hypothetical protein [bacterium]
MQKYKILILAVLILIIAGVWYFNMKAGDNNQKQNEEIAFITGFTLLDDEASLINSEQVELDSEVRAEFLKRVEEVKADLITAAGKEQRLADYNDLAIYEKYLGNYREAYNAYLQSLNLESQARVAWQNFADVLLKMKAYKSAEKAYKKSVELNKYIPESYVKLADYYKAMGDGANVEETYKTAIETIKESLESDTLVLDAYAEWLGFEKRYEEAIKFYQELIVKQPNNKAAIERKIENLKK